MSTPTFDQALTALHRTVAGEDPAFAGALAEARARSGVPDAEIPSYLPHALVALASGITTSQPVPADQRGFAWLLTDIVSLIPSASLIDLPPREGMEVPALGRALIITRDGDDERWQVAAWPTTGQPRNLDTFAPTPAQVRAWAHDQSLRFADQDEDLAISRPEYLPLVIELAADPCGPRRDLLLGIADRIATLPGRDLRAQLARARDAARATGDAALSAWADQLDQVVSFGAGHGPVDAAAAAAIARILMVGPRRPSIVLAATRVGDWWQFVARWPEPGARTLDALAIHAPTGLVRWSPGPRTPAELDALPTVGDRLATDGAS